MNRKIIIATLAAAALSMAGCADKEKKAAERLLEEVRANIEQGDYTLAISRLDTLDHQYAKQTSLRREGMRLRPVAIEGATLRKLEKTDSLIAELTIENDRQKENLRFVENPVEGYFVSSKEKKADFIGTNGIQARISPDGIFYIVSSTNKPVKSTAVTLSLNGEEARSKTVKHDDERNYRRNGIEVITFMSAECDTLGKFAEAHRGEDMTLTFEGEKPFTMDFKAEEVGKLADMHYNGELIKRSKRAQFDKTRYETALKIARDQQAKTFPDGDSE